MPYRLHAGVIAMTLLAAAGACAPTTERQAPRTNLDYPVAPRGNTVDDYSGVPVADPYRALEDLDAPATRAWVSAEAQLTQAYLDAIPQRQQLRARLTQLYHFERTGVPFAEHGRYFYTDNSGEQNQSVLLTAAPLQGAQSVALDPNLLPADNNPVVVGYVASHDARLLAYGVSVSGSDWTDWHIRDLVTGQDRADVLRYTKYYPPVFSADDRGLYYSAFPAPQPGEELSAADLHNAVYFHALGTTASSDRRVFEDRAHADWQFEPRLSSDGRWLVIRAGEGEVGDKGVEDLYLMDLSAAAPAAVAVARGFRAAFEFAGADAGRLYFLTSLGAPNGRVIGARSAAPAGGELEGGGRRGPVMRSNSAAGNVSLVAHQLIVRTIHDAHSRVLLYGLDGAVRGEIAPARAWHRAWLHRAAAGSGDLLRLLRYDPAADRLPLRLRHRQSRVFRRPRLAYDPEDFAEQQVFYPAKDGTRIPLLLAYRKGTNLKGDNPLLLTGYGGFGISYLPRFDPSVIAWMERGGVFAIANIRGGGEYGEPGTARRSSPTSRWCSMTSSPRPTGWSPTTTPPCRTWRSLAAPTAGCWSAPV